jgi:hypothetical protein
MAKANRCLKSSSTQKSNLISAIAEQNPTISIDPGFQQNLNQSLHTTIKNIYIYIYSITHNLKATPNRTPQNHPRTF